MSHRRFKGWSEYSDGRPVESPGKSYVGDEGKPVAPDSAARIVGVGSICGLRARHSEDDSVSQSFWVSEFVLLANGRRVILHEARGFTISAPIGPHSAGLTRVAMTRVEIERTVLAVVRPDPEDGQEHPWAWLAQLARGRGLDVTADQLSGQPYEVVLTEGLTRWLDPSIP